MSIQLKVIFTYSGGVLPSMMETSVIEAKKGSAVIWCKSGPICMCGKQLDPPPLPATSTTWWALLLHCVWIFYHWHAEHAQGLQLTLPSLRDKDFTFYFDACSGRQGAFPVQEGAKNTQSERGTTRNCLRRRHATTQHSCLRLWQSQLYAEGIWDI